MRHYETKNFRRKSLLLSILSYPCTFPLPEIFWNTTQEGFATKFFATARQTSFDGKSWFPPTLLSLTFWIPEINETLKDSLWNSSTLRDKYISTNNLGTLPLLLCIIFFATDLFRKHLTESFRTIFFSPAGQNSFYGKSWFPRTLSYL